MLCDFWICLRYDIRIELEREGGEKVIRSVYRKHCIRLHEYNINR